MKILFATNNKNKLSEVRSILGDSYDVLSLEDILFYEEIPEPFDTIRQNSEYKAEYFFQKTKLTCIAEDSGLEVESLQGKPSAFSARYAGEDRNDIRNYEKVLKELEGIENRKARFVSIFTYKSSTTCQCFEGEMEGNIALEPKGINGFGYDPIFIPIGGNCTNAELSKEEKNQISHRKKALEKLIDFMLSKNNSDAQ
jgi:XTP/dITP diphosphohydrolase